MLPTGGGCDATLSKLARSWQALPLEVAKFGFQISPCHRRYFNSFDGFADFSDVQSDVYGGGKIWLYHTATCTPYIAGKNADGRRGIPSRKWLPLSSRRWNTSVPGCSCLQVIFYHLVMTNIAMANGPFIDGLPIKNGDFPWLC